MKLIYYISFVFSAMILLSCNKNTIYQESHEIQQGIWDMNDTLSFSFNIEDTNVPYSLFFDIRITELYRNSNLWLFVITESPSGLRQTDTVECILADETGKWNGEHIGDIVDIQVPYKQAIGFPETGQYRLYVQHGMREEKLPMILKLGLKIKKLKPENLVKNDNSDKK